MSFKIEKWSDEYWWVVNEENNKGFRCLFKDKKEAEEARLRLIQIAGEINEQGKIFKYIKCPVCKSNEDPEYIVRFQNSKKYMCPSCYKVLTGEYWIKTERKECLEDKE